MTRYASATTVSSEQSRVEIERTLSRYGATAFMYATQGDRAAIMFEAHGRRLRFLLPLPARNAREITHRKVGKYGSVRRGDKDAQAAYEQACRQRWRALLLCLKAKLEAVESGIETFEESFLSHIMVPGTMETMGDRALPLLARAYETGSMPPLLPHLPEES